MLKYIFFQEGQNRDLKKHHFLKDPRGADTLQDLGSAATTQELENPGVALGVKGTEALEIGVFPAHGCRATLGP